jgi:hypothetical protein
MAVFDQATMLAEMESKVETHLDHAVRTFQNLTDAQLNRPSPTGGWSIAECLWHLNSYALYYHPHLGTAIGRARPAGGGVYRETWAGSLFARMMDPTTGTMKSKAFKAHVPPPGLDGHRVVMEFIGHQEHLLLRLREAGKVDMRSVRIPISIMPWARLPLGDVFRFLVAHDGRHVAQALRNLGQ